MGRIDGEPLDCAPRLRGKCSASIRLAHGGADECDGFVRLLQCPLVGHEHSDAGADESGRDVGLEVGEAEDKVRLQGEDAVDVGGLERGDLGFLAGFGWAHRIAADAYDTVASADGKGDFGGFGGKADDAAGRHC